MHIHVCCAHVFMHVHICMCMWRVRGWQLCLPWSLFIFYIEIRAHQFVLGGPLCALKFPSREWGGLRGFHWDACWLLRSQAGCCVYPAFMWVLGTQNQVLTFVRQILFPWRYFPSPLSSFEYRPFSCKMGICSLGEENKMRRESLHIAAAGCT